MNLNQAKRDILSFMEKAGAYALEKQDGARNHIKEDNSIVTEVDLHITTMAKNHFADWLAQPGHTLVDEESLEELDTPENVFANNAYQWVLDPIDGTAMFASNLPMWGIMLGVLHKGEPLLGAVYLPVTGELFWASPEETIEYRRAFTSQQTEKRLVPQVPTFSHETFSNIALSAVPGPVFQLNANMYCQLYAASVVSAYTSTYRLKCGVYNAKIWDHAAAMPLAKNMGVGLYSVHSGEKIERFEAHHFDNDWRLKSPILYAHESIAPEVLALLQQSIEEHNKQQEAA